MKKSLSYELTQHALKRLNERSIPQEWVERTLSSPQKTEPDKNDPELMHALATIPDHDNRVLRVVYKPTANTVRVITIYFDRSVKGKI